MRFNFLSCLSFFCPKETFVSQNQSTGIHSKCFIYQKYRDFHWSVCSFTYFIKQEWLKTSTKKPPQRALCPKKEATNDLLTMGSHLFAHFRRRLPPFYLAISAQVTAPTRHSDSSLVPKQQELAQGSLKPASILREKLGWNAQWVFFPLWSLRKSSTDMTHDFRRRKKIPQAESFLLDLKTGLRSHPRSNFSASFLEEKY